jgi:hypothetical protein
VGCSERYTEHFEILFFDLECMSIIAKGILFFFGLIPACYTVGSIMICLGVMPSTCHTAHNLEITN